MKRALAPAQDLNDKIKQLVRTSDSLEDALIILPALVWREGQQRYADHLSEELVRGMMYGRLQVAMQYDGLELAASTWTSLPFSEAIERFLARKLMTRAEFDRLHDRYKARAWTIAGDHNLYTIEQTRRSLVAALSEGWSQQQWVNTANDLFAAWGVSSRGDHHLRTVFETTVQGSYQHGRWDQMRTPDMLERRPYWVYRTVGDSRVRDNHRAMDGMTYRADHPVWNTHYPPNGFRCRCRVEALRSSDHVAVDLPEAQPDKGFASSPANWLP